MGLECHWETLGLGRGAKDKICLYLFLSIFIDRIHVGPDSVAELITILRLEFRVIYKPQNFFDIGRASLLFRIEAVPYRGNKFIASANSLISSNS